MARQNQKNTRKNQGVKVRENQKLIKSKFFEKKQNVELKNKKTVKNKKIAKNEKIVKNEKLEKLNDTRIISEINQKVKVLNDVSTVDGTLHKSEIVTVEALTSTGYKVIDNVGRFWFVNIDDVSTKL